MFIFVFFFFQAEDGIRDGTVTGVQTCALPILADAKRRHPGMRIPKTRAAFEVLVPTVIGQKVATNAAHESYRKLVYELGTIAPGPANLRVAPPAAVLAP